MAEILTRSRLKRECIIYLASNTIISVSYRTLYNYLVKEKGLDLTDYAGQTVNNDLLSVLAELTRFELTKYTNHDINTALYGNDETDKKRQLHEIENKIQNHYKFILTVDFDVRDIVFDEYEKELRLQKTEEDSKHANKISKWSYRIAIIALIITGVQLLADLWDVYGGKDHKFETTTMHSDSTQIIQHQRIIELLEKQNIILESTRKQDSIKSTHDVLHHIKTKKK